MPNRKTLFAAAIALVGVSLGAQFADAKERADSSESMRESKRPARRPDGGTGAKLGEACKTNFDCDQGSGEMRCGKGKCEYDLSGAHPQT